MTAILPCFNKVSLRYKASDAISSINSLLISACCMYATKQAIVTKERTPEVECKIFATDVMAFRQFSERR
jgi:heterodisulfide reductase subunit A-like polyferredoxin